MRARLAASPSYLLIWALLFIFAAAGWLVTTRDLADSPVTAAALDRLDSGSVASMDSAVFAFEPGWQVSVDGADTTEPDQPWREPSGRMAFQYSGRELALKLALGDYWGYIFVKVDGRPANRLPTLPGNLDSLGQPSGYLPLFAPEKQTETGPVAEWIIVHNASTDGPHQVTVEVWRGWGQTVLRAVAVDAMPAVPRPQWPAVLLAMVGVWLAFISAGPIISNVLAARLHSGISASTAGPSPDELRSPWNTQGWTRRVSWLISVFPWNYALILAMAGVVAIGAGTAVQNWLLTDAGLIMLGFAGLQRPVLWTGALLFGLPLYLYPLPILPGRALNLIEIGVYGGLGLTVMRLIFVRGRRPNSGYKPTAFDSRHRLFFVLVSFALVSAFAAEQEGVALREWRTLFLSAGLFALLLHLTFRRTGDSRDARTFLALYWLAGGAFVACAGLWQYVTEQNIIQAEGVNRIRAFYGSPNNLGLYLERTTAMGLGLAIFGGWSAWGQRDEEILAWRERIPLLGSWKSAPLWARGALLLTIPQLLALLLTFSKGAIFLGLPAMLLTLAVAGRRLLAAPGGRLSARWGWGLAAVATAMVLGLVPFLGTERFRSLLDFRPEGTAGIRLSLWRSSVQMALDHLWLGVGPDNFLYSYRSGYILPAAWRDPSLNHPHNVVLDWWTRLGLPGLALAAAWLALGIRSLWRAATSDAIAVGAFGAVAAALGHGLIDASYALPDLLIVWVFLLHLFSPPAAPGPVAVPEEPQSA
ncbi:MAG: O-antigen ligase family protein [Caldilineaceae bacterium SB0675_bin_29]|uniref:O-antigen ligase family protein n=1 Tax=Caldilineaceae bacterium SB0675_bin_29 TaxID=2605266 RepID=A0A6B1G0Y3_9CHLR|nr:O-antigen ligase family protein [Caldilineaceae bacterium SB0675_bin_29]